MIQDILQTLQTAKEPLSGQVLADMLGVSRTTIWKHIENLRKEGYQITSLAGQGYLLTASPHRSNLHELQQLTREGNLSIAIQIHDEVTSTNDLMKQTILNQYRNQPQLIVAHRQTQGRGRQGRTFHSQIQEGLYFSLGFQPQGIPLEDLHLYTLLAGVAMAEAIEATYPLPESIQLKWVNDLFYQGKKIGGILSESVMSLEDSQVMYIIIGIGLNIAADFTDSPMEQVAGSLFTEDVPEAFNQNKLLTHFLERFDVYNQNFQGRTFIQNYQERLLGRGKWLSYEMDGQSYEGELIGMNSHGQLLMRNQINQVVQLDSHRIHLGSNQFKEV